MPARCGSIVILASLCGLLIIWPLMVVLAILVKVKMPGGPAFFCHKRVDKDGKLFTCHKFRTMIPVKDNLGANGKKGDKECSSVSVAGDSRITPFGAKLRHWKIDELPELWDVLGPATLKYRLEDEMLASLRLSPDGMCVTDWQGKSHRPWP